MSQTPYLMGRPAPVVGPVHQKAIVIADRLNASPANPPYDAHKQLSFGDTVYEYSNLSHGSCIFKLSPKAGRYYFAAEAANFGPSDERTISVVVQAKLLDRQIDKLQRERKRIVKNRIKAMFPHGYKHTSESI